jgi:hypothetical protein
MRPYEVLDDIEKRWGVRLEVKISRMDTPWEPEKWVLQVSLPAPEHRAELNDPEPVYAALDLLSDTCLDIVVISSVALWEDLMIHKQASE